ncbi:MAG: hypothetical protein ACI8P9_004549 [Parasphingorhabdus sp.]|jgi:uncharacterized protein (DUF934 family)
MPSYLTSCTVDAGLHTIASSGSTAALIELTTDQIVLDMTTEQLEASAIRVTVDSFTDGRVFSIGYMLRARLKYNGRLIAAGDILQDQVNSLKRCGFDTIESIHSTSSLPGKVLRGNQPVHRYWS